MTKMAQSANAECRMQNEHSLAPSDEGAAERSEAGGEKLPLSHADRVTAPLTRGAKGAVEGRMNFQLSTINSQLFSRGICRGVDKLLKSWSFPQSFPQVFHNQTYIITFFYYFFYFMIHIYFFISFFLLLYLKLSLLLKLILSLSLILVVTNWLPAKPGKTAVWLGLG